MAEKLSDTLLSISSLWPNYSVNRVYLYNISSLIKVINDKSLNKKHVKTTRKSSEKNINRQKSRKGIMVYLKTNALVQTIKYGMPSQTLYFINMRCITIATIGVISFNFWCKLTNSIGNNTTLFYMITSGSRQRVPSPLHRKCMVFAYIVLFVSFNRYFYNLSARPKIYLESTLVYYELRTS